MLHIFFAALFMLFLVCPAWAQDDTGESCSGLTPVSLIVGEFGRVSPGNANNVRSAPNTSGERLGTIPGGEEFSILDGPQCSDGLVWWQVDYQGLVGWTVDGADGEQWLFPVDATEPDNDQPPRTEPPITLFMTPISSENASLLAPLRDVVCESGADFTPTIALSNNQRYVALHCGQEDATGIYDLVENRQIASLTTGSGASGQYFFLPGDQQLLVIYYVNSRSEDPQTFAVWDIAAGEVIASMPYDHRELARYDAVNNEIVLLEQEQIRRLDANTLEESHSLPLPQTNDGNFADLALSADGATLAAISNENAGVITLWDTASGEVLQQIETPFMTNILTTEMTFSPSGRYIVAAGCEERTGDAFFCGRPEILWGEVATGNIIERWDVPTSGENNSISITSMAFSPDGELLVAGAGSHLLVYGVQTGALMSDIENRSHEAIFSVDGTFIVTTGDGVFTRVWAVPG